MRKVARTNNAIKPSAKLPTSAVKPSAKHTLLEIRHLAKPSAQSTPRAAKPGEHDEVQQAMLNSMSSYDSYQARLHKMSEDIQVILFTVFDSQDTPSTLRISWRSCWGRLECMLKAIFLEVLHYRIIALSCESSKRLYKVLEALKAKLTCHHHHLVLQNQFAQLLECFTDLLHKTSNVSTWHTILGDLLDDTNSNSRYRNAQADLIEYHLDHANQGLRHIASRGQQIALSTHE